MAADPKSTLELIIPEWPAPARVRAIATTRTGGVSTGKHRSLNLGSHVGDDPPAVAENRRRLAEELDLPADPLWLNQVHGVTVVKAAQHAGAPMTNSVTAPAPRADAMTAEAHGQVCAVLTADCLPVLFCDTAGTCVAAAHAGWRGLAGGVLEATINALADRGVGPAKLLAWLGPAISGPAYEVGGEIRDVFFARDRAAAAGFTPNSRGRWQLDLAVIARQRLVAAGVSRICGGNFCTHADPTRFFSHRRDGSCGRQATLIWLERDR